MHNNSINDNIFFMNHGNAREMTRLEQLAYKYGTDKFQHGYIPFYEKHLPKEPKRILEIGIKEGRSLAMWAEYFPDAEIHGLDLFEEYDITAVKTKVFSHLATGQLCELHKGNQCDHLILEQLRKLDFDVIIDDGSHNSRDQMMTFFGLFNGKHYFIEDLHTNTEEFYSQELPIDFAARNIFGDMLACDAEFGENENRYIDFNRDSKIVLIKYAAQSNPIN